MDVPDTIDTLVVSISVLALGAAFYGCGRGEASSVAPPGDDDLALADDDSGGGADDDASPGDDDGVDPGGAPCEGYGLPTSQGTLKDGALNEVSGLAVSVRNPGILWVLEDSGGPATLTAIDGSGATRGTLALEGTANVDWEDLALGPCGEGACLFVGEFGDNGAARSDAAVLRLTEPLLPPEPGFALSATPERFPFTYPGGPRDAESLVVTPGGVPVVLSKRDDATADLFAFPKLVAGVPVELLPWGSIETGPAAGLASMATAADLWPDGSRLLVRTYFGLREWEVPGDGLAALAGVVPRDVPAALEGQGEAVAYDPARRGFWQISEGNHPPLWFAGCKKP